MNVRKIIDFANSKRYFVPLVCMVFLMCLICGYFFDFSNLFSCITIVLFLMCCCCLKTEKLMAILLFLFSYGYIYIEFWGLSIYNCLMAIFAIYLTFKYCYDIIKKKKKIILLPLIFSSLMFILMFINFNTQNILQWFNAGLLILLVYLCYIYYDEIDIINIVWYFFSGILLSCLLAFLFMSLTIEKSLFNVYIDGRFQGLTQNPNTLHILCVISISILLILWFKNKINNYLIWVLTGLFSLIGIITKSKAFLICLLLMVFIIGVLVLIKYKKRGIPICAIIFLICICCFFVFKDGFMDIFKRFSEYSYNNIMDVILTGRWSIWKQYLIEWSENFYSVFFGLGVTANKINNMSVHNTYIELLYYFGVLGMLIIMLLIYSYLRLVKDKNKRIKCGANLIPLIMFLFLSIEESLLFTFIIPFIMILYLIFDKSEKSKEQYKELKKGDVE